MISGKQFLEHAIHMLSADECETLALRCGIEGLIVGRWCRYGPGGVLIDLETGDPVLNAVGESLSLMRLSTAHQCEFIDTDGEQCEAIGEFKADGEYRCADHRD